MSVVEARAPYLSPVIGHEETLLGLWRSASEGRLSHALGFFGPLGVGKFLSARRLAAGLLCDQGPGPPCGTCPPCKRVVAGSHGNVHILDALAEGEERIKVGRISPRAEESPEQGTVLEFAHLRAAERGPKVILLREFERAAGAPQNALLKTLEEPPGDTVLVLECSVPGTLLDTIRSRLVEVAFGPLPLPEVAELLAAHGLARAEALDLARVTGGSPGAALAAQVQGLLGIRDALGSFLAGEEPALAAAERLRSSPGEWPGKTPAAAMREKTRGVLDVALAILGDIQRLQAGLPQATLAFGPVAERARLFELSPALDAVLQARMDVGINLSPEGILDRALLTIEPCLRLS